MPYLLFLERRQNLKLSSAANYRWRFNHLSQDEADSGEEEVPVYGPTEPQEFREDALVVRSLPGAGDTPRDGETPRDEETPRGVHTVSTMSEEESVSEWELERQKVS